MCEAPNALLQELGRGEATAIGGGRAELPPISLWPLEPPFSVPLELEPRF